MVPIWVPSGSGHPLIHTCRLHFSDSSYWPCSRSSKAWFLGNTVMAWSINEDRKRLDDQPCSILKVAVTHVEGLRYKALSMLERDKDEKPFSFPANNCHSPTSSHLYQPLRCDSWASRVAHFSLRCSHFQEYSSSSEKGSPCL